MAKYRFAALLGSRYVAFGASFVMAVGIIALLLFLDFGQKHNRLGLYIDSNYSDMQSYLFHHVETSGASTTRAEVRLVGNTLDVSRAHVLAHAFGEALYRVEGLSGFEYCDEKFSYGCTHQFMGLAIAELGSGAVKQLADMCTSRWGESAIGCAHAMGHGIEGYHGYTSDGLLKAMHECDVFESESAQEKCLSGVFMEFNFRELASLENSDFITARSFNSDNPYEPCDELTGVYANACFYQLPLWWQYVSHAQTRAESSENLREQCASAMPFGREAADACYTGVGLVAASITNLDPVSTEEVCATVAGTFRERLLCLSEAVFKFKLAGVKNATDLCASYDLEDISLGYCRSRAER